MRPGAQQFYSGLITNLHAPAGEQGDAPAQIRRLGALEKIQFRTRRAKLVVKMMNPDVYKRQGGLFKSAAFG